jgi:two-component system response regulator AtoC
VKRVLIVDDDAVSCRLLSEVLAGEGLLPLPETSPLRERVEQGPVDLAILDLRMPEINGLDLLRRLRERIADLPVIIMTGFGSVDTAVEAIATGAVDYVSKPMNVEEIRATVRRALRRHAEAEAAVPLGNTVLPDLVGRTPAMVEVYKTIARVAPGPSTVLILGESGTGKEMVARAIHQHSPRRDKAFVAVDCAALPESLLESELFGYVRGAFTGALRDAPGLFVESDGGTIFLDEIGDTTAALQAKLLRALQERQVRPVGDTQWRSVDVRIVAATNRDLPAMVAAGSFREDLYYRLKVVTIRLPPLRERRDDIALLVDHLVQRAGRQFGKRVTGVSEEALAWLRGYDWPGNVRELAHVLERGVALAQHEVIGLDDLPLELRMPAPPDRGNLLQGAPTLEQLKERYIRRVVEENGGNISRSAAILGIDRRSLYRMLRRYGISHRPPSDE